MKNQYEHENLGLAGGHERAKELWQAYWANRCDQTLGNLAVHYLGMVKRIAKKLMKDKPPVVELDDLISEGTIGLMTAIKSYNPDHDPDNPTQFTTYCLRRVRGAMLDSLRRYDWVPRLVRKRSAAVEKVRASIEMATGISPTVDELEKVLDVNKKDFEILMRDSKALHLGSLSHRYSDSGTGYDHLYNDIRHDVHQDDPSREAELRDMVEFMFANLSSSERTIVVLYGGVRMTMREVGLVVDLSESRVSQLYESIISRLKGRFGDSGARLQSK